MLPSDNLQNFTQPQSTTNAESAPDVEVEKKKLHKESMNSSLTSMEPQNSSEEYMASYSRNKEEGICFYTRRRIDEKRKIEKREKIQEKFSEKIKEIRERQKSMYENQEKDDIGGEFSLFPCCKEIDNPEELFEHIKKHHDKDATQCALCGKELSSKSSLDRHLLIHAKWQPYQCSHCNKQFSTNGNMHRHKKTHKAAHKGSRHLKEEVSSVEETVSAKKVKKESMNIKNEENSLLNIDIDLLLKKRKMCKAAMTESTLSKKIKVDSCSENVFFQEMSDLSNSKTEEEELEKDTVIPGLSHKRPSKQEFIATLGLQNVCKFEENQPLSVVNCEPVLNDESADIRSLTERYQEQEKVSSDEKDFSSDTENEEALSEIADEVNDQELVIDFRKEQEDLADITSILTNMKYQNRVVPLKVKEESTPECNFSNDSVSDTDNCSLNKSKESSPSTSTSAEMSEELKFFVPKEEPQQLNGFICSYCRKSFNNKNSFQKHLEKHGKPKPFKCMECGAKLLNKPNAIRHVIKVHKMKRGVAKAKITYNLESGPISGTKTVCDWCGRDFTSNLILEHHKRSLTGCPKKPFLCLLCSKTFSTKNNGRRHQAQYHREERNNVIVPNDAVQSNQPSTSSSVSPVAETSNNCSERGSSSSSDSNLFRESSLPSKELAAAEVLLNLSMHTSKNDSIEQHEHEEDDMQLDAPIDLKNVSSFNMSNNITHQECPLDLTCRPMDLRKSFQKEYPSRKCVSDSFLDYHNIYMSPSKEKESMSSLSSAEKQTEFFTEAPLNLVKKDSFTLNIQPSTSQSSFAESNHLDVLNFSLSQDSSKNRSQSSSSVEDNTKLQCDFCSISFANNSNKRRHEKKKHLLHGQETVPIHNSQECSEPKKSKSVLSEKTKEALITKVSLRPTAGTSDYSPSGSSTLNPPMVSLSSEAEGGDLASVSSLINTANSPQLKKYLTTESNCDVMPSQDLTTSANGGDVTPKQTSQRLDGKKVSDKHWCDTCEKEFTCKSSFNRHLVIHTKERNFHCSECNKTFTVKSNRDRHLKKIHKITFTQVGRRSLVAGKRPQNNSETEVPRVEGAMELDVKDLTLPKELLQCNKENQRLFMPS